METIGTIAFVQIQRASLKRDNGAGGLREYNPEPLYRVDRIRLTLEGVIGITETDEEIIDVHHTLHPQSKSNGTGVSLGFLPHYELMRAEFGEHLTDGIAGENIVVASTAPLTPEVLGERVGIRRRVDGSVITLESVRSAPPCEPFSRYCAGGKVEAAEMKRILQFLDRGTRGYYAEVVPQHAMAEVSQGDELVRLA